MAEDSYVEELRESFALKRLQERVWRLEEDNKDLAISNGILESQYTSQTETQSDMLRLLRAKLHQCSKDGEEQEGKRKTLEQALEDQKQRYEDKLEEERRKWEAHVVGLQKQVEDLQNRLGELKDFQLKKNELQSRLQGLERQLHDQQEEHSRDMSAHDRKKAIEIDQLKKDMQRSIKETREMLKAKTKDQLDSTTKRTIMENEQMATELHFQSRETERLIDRNQALLKENAQLRRNLQVHKDLENELARRSHVYQKLLKKMDQKQKVELQPEQPTREPALGELLSQELPASPEMSAGDPKLGSFTDLSLDTTLPTRDDHERLQRELESAQSTLQLVREEFAHYRRDHATLTQLQDQSTRLIISALYELKNQRDAGPFPPPSYDENANWQFVTMTGKQKEYFFRVLLEKLNSSMCGSCFPVGPQPPATGQAEAAAMTLPQIHKPPRAFPATQATPVAPFLWSVATPGTAATPARGEQRACGTQTEPSTLESSLRDVLRTPQSRGRSGPLTGGPWGPRASNKSRSLGRVI